MKAAVLLNRYGWGLMPLSRHFQWIRAIAPWPAHNGVMDPRKLGQWFQASIFKDEVEAFHQQRVHLNSLGEGELAQLVVDGRR
jgi:hypothetical protein